jgi:VanZ family protein
LIRVQPRRAALVVAYMAFVYCVSAVPGSWLAGLRLSYGFWDFLHVPLYAGLASVTLFAVEGPAWVRVPFALCLCLAFGFTDEWHQQFVPGRVFSWHDIGNDLVGALLGITAREGFFAADLPREKG